MSHANMSRRRKLRLRMATAISVPTCFVEGATRAARWWRTIESPVRSFSSRYRQELDPALGRAALMRRFGVPGPEFNALRVLVVSSMTGARRGMRGSTLELEGGEGAAAAAAAAAGEGATAQAEQVQSVPALIRDFLRESFGGGGPPVTWELFMQHANGEHAASGMRGASWPSAAEKFVLEHSPALAAALMESDSESDSDV